MGDEERRLFALDPSSSAYTLRLERVQRDVRAQAQLFEHDLCTLAGINEDELHHLLEQFTIGELNMAIQTHGTDFATHLGTSGKKTEDPRAPGWLAQWEIDHDK